MFELTILATGKLKEPHYLAACQEYQKRLGAYARVQVIELPEQRLPEAPSEAEIEAALSKEADAILEKLPRVGVLVALCVEGRAMSSEQLSDALTRYAARGASQVTFLVGGSFGLHERVKQRAELRLSMSPMTFPHHLARVMLLEQIYRAYQIQAGTKYHK